MMRIPTSNRSWRWLWLSGRIVAMIALIGILALFALWSFRAPLLDDYARPRLEQLLSKELAARVEIGRIELAVSQLQLLSIRAKSPDRYLLNLAAMTLDFNLANLLRGRLDRLHLIEPELHLNLADPHRSDPEAQPARWPKPPFEISHFQLSGGRIELALQAQTLVGQAVEMELKGGPSGDFQLTFELITEQATEQPLALAAAGRLNWDTDPEISIDQLQLAGQQVLSAPLRLHPAGADVTGGGEIRFDRLDRDQLESWLALTGWQEQLPPDLDFSLRHLRLGGTLESGRFQARLAAESIQLSQNDLDLNLHDVALDLTLDTGGSDYWQATGRLNLAPLTPLTFQVEGPPARMAGHFEGRFPDAAGLPALLGRPEIIPVNGGLDWQAKATWQEGIIGLHGTFSGIPGSSDEPAERATLFDMATLNGAFQVDGPPDALDGTLRTNLADSPFLTLQGNSDRLDIELRSTPLSVLAQQFDSTWWPQFVEQSGQLGGTARLQHDNGNWQGEFNLNGSGFQASGFKFGDSRIAGNFRRQDNRLELTDLTGRTRLSGQGTSFPEVNFRGSARQHQETLELTIDSLNIEGVDYASSDGMQALAGGALHLSGFLRWQDRQTTLHTALQGSIQIDELLYQSFYGDLSSLKTTFELQGKWDSAAVSGRIEQAQISVAQVGLVHGHGNWQSGQIQADGELSLPRLQDGFNRQLRPLLTPLFPWLDDLSLDGALTLTGESRLNTDGWQLTGTLRPEAFGLHRPAAALELTDLTGEIPLALSSHPVAPDPERSGFLAFSQLRVGPITAAAQNLVLTTQNNQLRFNDPWQLELAGGRGEINDLRLGHKPEGILLAGRTRIQNIDLDRLTRELELTPITGELTADLGLFEYSGGVLRSEGEARIDVFGGTIRLRQPRARDIFSSFRSFEGEITLDGIDLAQLTRTFEFGQINGIIDGTIRELRLFGKVPSAFIADISSRDQGRRNISVRAINNLSVISQGGMSRVLSRGIYSFIDFYRYRKIGLQCVLRNDLFVIRGNARPGSDRYLIDGGLLPPRIDVLAPTTAVSFREMLRRLERIDRTASN